MAPTSLTNVVRFPRAKKRGANVRNGPQATVLDLPIPLTGDALKSRWAWLQWHSRQWGHEATEGNWDDAPGEWESSVRIGPAYAHFDGCAFDEAYMRRQVGEFEAAIRNRVALKDWLETIGIDWSTAKTPEDALFFLASYVKGRTNE